MYCLIGSIRSKKKNKPKNKTKQKKNSAPSIIQLNVKKIKFTLFLIIYFVENK